MSRWSRQVLSGVTRSGSDVAARLRLRSGLVTRCWVASATINGASRGRATGVGRAIAEVLGECGATVYVTGRSTRAYATTGTRWTVEETAELVDMGGGQASQPRPTTHPRTMCDRLFQRIDAESRGLDLLVNNVWQWGPPENDTVLPRGTSR